MIWDLDIVIPPPKTSRVTLAEAQETQGSLDCDEGVSGRVARDLVLQGKVDG